jgi:hypothetical protein
VALTTGTTELAPGFVFTTISAQRLVVVAHASAQGADFRDLLQNNPYVRFSRQPAWAKWWNARWNITAFRFKP